MAYPSMMKTLNNNPASYQSTQMTSPRDFSSQLQRFKFIHQLYDSKYITQQQIGDLVKLIEKSHISILIHLKAFFVDLIQQLNFCDIAIYEVNRQRNQKGIKLSKYFNQGKDFDQQLLKRLCLVTEEKLNYYREKQLKQNTFDKEGPKEKINQKKIRKSSGESTSTQDNTPPVSPRVNLKKQNLSNYFPNKNQSAIESISKRSKNETSSKIDCIFIETKRLITQIRFELQFMKELFKNDDQQNYKFNFQKDLLVQKISQNVQKQKNVTYGKFKKDQYEENNQIHLNQNEFFEIKNFIEKCNLDDLNNQEALIQVNDSQQQLQSIDQDTPIPVKCINCITHVIKNKPLHRQRCSMINFEIFHSITDIVKCPKRLKKIIEGCVNNDNGGVILFDCKDQFFTASPQGYASIQGKQDTKLESRKQSLTDRLKNIFSNLKINVKFQIDFIPIKQNNKKNSNNIITKSSRQYLTRLKIIKKIDNKLMIQNEFQQNKEGKVAFVLKTHYVENLNIQQYYKLMEKKHFITNQFPFIMSIEQNQRTKQHNDFIDSKPLEFFQGRITPLKRHQRKCQQSSLEVFHKQGYLMLNNETDYSNEKDIDEKLKFWNLIVVDISQKPRLQLQLKLIFPNELFSLENLPAQCKSIKQNTTLLLKTEFSHEELQKKLNSPQAEKNHYFRMKVQDSYKLLTIIKVYDQVLVQCKREITEQEIQTLRNEILSNEINNRLKQSQRYFQSSKCKVFINYVLQQQKNSKQQRTDKLCVTIQSQIPSYCILFVYCILKNLQYSNKHEYIRQVNFKMSNAGSNLKQCDKK